VEVGSRANFSAGTVTTRTPMVRYSDDLGATWTEHPIPVTAEDGNPMLLAATASDPMKIVVALPRTGAQEPPDRVLLSTDNGVTFSSYIDGITQVGQTLVTPDGRFFLADMGWTAPNRPLCPPPAGLWSAPQVGAPLEKIADYAVSCLGYDETNDALFLCKAYEFGRFYPAQRAYCRLFKMSDTASFVMRNGDPATPCERENLAADVDVEDQLCRNWCGALHYSDSPFCSVMSCSAFARDYDLMAGWVPPPTESAASCSGFVPGQAGGSDAGSGIPGCESDAGPNAGVDAGSSDGGAPSEDDGSVAAPAGDGSASVPGSEGGVSTPAGGPASDAGLEAATPAIDSSINPGEGEEPGGDGCDCSVRGGTTPPDLAGLGMVLWLLGRSARLRSRKPVHDADA
jgi:hypothetical protein